MDNYEIIIDDDHWESFFDKDQIISPILRHPEFISGSKMLKQVQHDGILEFSVLLTNDAKIQQLNRDFREKDKPTNVLSFPSDMDDYLGDIAIAFETVEREAKEQNKPLSHHATHMILHGILHLLGYDHETDEEATEMETLEIKILEDMGIKNPYI